MTFITQPQQLCGGAWQKRALRSSHPWLQVAVCNKPVSNGSYSTVPPVITERGQDVAERGRDTTIHRGGGRGMK